MDGRGAPALRVIFVVAMALALVSCKPRRDTSEDVQLLLTTKDFQADSSFELRFPEDMATADLVGQTVKLSPLRVEPRLPGIFRWLGPRKGLYIPTEAPRLGTKYRFFLSSGLRNAAGQTVSTRLERTLETPPFRVTNLRTSFRYFTNVPARPIVALEFNAPVSIRKVKPHVVFSSHGREIPATVRRFHGDRLSGYLTDTELGRRDAHVGRDWQMVFAASRPSAPAPVSVPPPIPPPPISLLDRSGGAQTNVITVTPSEPLTPGSEWVLKLRSGLPSTRPALALKKTVAIRIGKVEPMRVLRAEARNHYNRGKRIVVSMNRRPHHQMLDKITVSPQPERFSITVVWNGVLISGGFELDRDYAVTVAPDLVSLGGEALDQGFQTLVRFRPLPPLIRFPDFNVVQQAGGSGLFRFETVNTPRIDFRAKRLNPQSYRQLLRNYDHYARGGLREVPFDLVPGSEIPQFRVRSEAERDTTDQITIDVRDKIDRRHGAIFVQASSPGLKGSRHRKTATQAILQHTDIGLLWKNHATGSWVHAFSLLDGSPLKDVDLNVLNSANETVGEAQTDTTGIAHLGREGMNAHLFATLNHDVNGLNRSGSKLARYGMGFPISWRGFGEAESRVLFFIDKPVCRPGDEVRFKAIARRIGDDVRVEQDEVKRRARLQIYDPRNRSVLSTNLHLSKRGSLDFKFTTPLARFGAYRATLSWAGEYKSIRYVAQDYEANAFEVNISGPNRLLAEEPIDLPVAARYFLGKDITAAKVKWSLQASDELFAPKGFADFRFGNWIQDSRIISGQDYFSVHGGGAISPTNRFAIRTNVPIDIVTPAPRRVQAYAEVTDMNQQTVTAQKSLLIDSSEYYLGLAPPTESLRVGDVFTPHIIAIDRFGQPVKTNLNSTLRLRRIKWHTVAIKGAGNTVRYRNELKLIDLFRTNTPVDTVVREGTSWQIDTNSPSVALPAFETPARYLLEAEGMDAQGNRIYTAITFHVAGVNQAVWEQRNDKRIDLVPDRGQYRVGDHAEILVKSPIKGRALVSVERNTIHHTFTTNLTGNATVIRVPLTAKDTPNTFVNVTVLRGAADSPRTFKEPDYRYGYCQLQVVDEANRLQVTAAPERPEYLPGDQVKIHVDVLDSKGVGVPNAEVTLYAVDEGVLSLRGYETPDPLALFNAARRHAVSTHLSLMQLQPEDPAKIQYWNKGFLAGGGGDPIQRGARTNFVACPLWKPGLITDQQGRAAASFTAPDSLTRYRIIAVAHAGTDRFGHAEDKVEVDKPLIVEPVLPRFARRGDRLNVRALLINQTEHDDTVEVTWERLGDILTEGPARLTQRVALKAGQAKTARFPLVFKDTGLARWKWSARFLSTNVSDFADSVISKLAVEEPLPLMRASLIGAISGKTNLLATVDPQLLGGSGQVTVRISNSPFIQLNGGMTYLLRYPYGCVEQTSSSLLPWILIQSDPILRRLYRKTPKEINQAIAAGVNRLSSMQLTSGGFSYWPGGNETSHWSSAYAGMVLTLAQQGGAEVTGIRLDRLARFLSEQVNRADPRRTPSFNESHAMALYTLALLGHRKTTLLERLHAQRKTLAAETCAFGALALVTGKMNDADSKMAADLLEESRLATRIDFHHFGSRTRLRAIELMAHRRLRTGRESELMQKLFAARKQGCWISTQENAWSLLALAASKKPDGRKVATQLTWGQESTEFILANDPVQHEKTFKLSAARSLLPLELTMPEDAALFAEVEVSAHVDRKFEPVTDQGFTIQRYFHKLATDGSPTAPVDLEISDTIVVTLDIAAETNADYVAIDDPLPSVLQAVNPEFKSQASGKDNWSTATWHSSHRELRKDRALFFRNHLPRGKYRIQYLARVRADGQCTAPPSRIEMMYEPDRHGFSAPQRLEARR